MKKKLPDQSEPPSHLSTAGKKLWQAHADELVEFDTPARLMLTVMCEAADRRDDARAGIAKGGAVVEDRFGQLKPSPWIAIERDSTLALQRAWRLLGFDLAAVPK